MSWRLLCRHYRDSGLKEKRSLVEAFDSMKMGIGVHPRMVTMRVDKATQELHRPGTVILKGVSSDFDAEVRLLVCSNGINPPGSKTPQRLSKHYQGL